MIVPQYLPSACLCCHSACLCCHSACLCCHSACLCCHSACLCCHSACLCCHRTFDPEEADFFYVPVYTSCYINPVHAYHDGPWWYAPKGEAQARTALA